MTIDELIRAVRADLSARVDEVYREGATAFFRETIDIHGVRAGDLKKVEQMVYREVKQWPAPQRNKFCNELWKGGKFEEGAIAVYLYRRFRKSCAACEFRLFERWIDRYVHNWAHCDGVSSWLLSASIANDPALIAELPPWTTSGNRWKRRASAVALLQEAKHGRHTAEIFDIAARLLDDRDDMVEKGVGWLLKETYPRKPLEVVTFLKQQGKRASRLTLRYAAERMTPQDGATVLAK